MVKFLKIERKDALNTGREKLNNAIDGSEDALSKSTSADQKATQALANSESTQTQLDTIVTEGDSSVEAAQARVDEKGEVHPTLKARIDDGLNSVNQQLAETTTKTDLQNAINPKADRSYVDFKTQGLSLAYKESYSTLGELQDAYQNGDDYNHVVLTDGMIYTWVNDEWLSTQIQANGTGISNDSITQEHLSFIKRSTNLINPDSEHKGYSISAENGSLIKNINYNTSEFIKVEPRESFSSFGLSAIGRYDINKQFISRGNLNPEEFTFGVGDSEWIRVHYMNNTGHNIQLNRGLSLLPYERGYTPYTERLTVDNEALQREKLDPLLSGYNDFKTELIFQDGRINGMRILDNDVEVSKVSLNYNEFGEVLSAVEEEGGRRVTTTLNRDANDNVIGATNSYMGAI